MSGKHSSQGSKWELVWFREFGYHRESPMGSFLYSGPGVWLCCYKVYQKAMQELYVEALYSLNSPIPSYRAADME